jgi:transcriptional regulator
MPRASLLQGTLDLLILRTLATGPKHGVGIADRIAQATRGTFTVKAGSLFPALHRLERHGWIAGAWGESPSGHRARLYTLTRTGSRQLASQEKTWARVSLAIQQVLAMR